MGKTFSYTEGFNLIKGLILETASLYGSKTKDWDAPVTLEWIALQNIADILIAANSKGKPKPTWRPWDRAEKKKPAEGDKQGITGHHGKTSLPLDEARKILEMLGTAPQVMKEEEENG